MELKRKHRSTCKKKRENPNKIYLKKFKFLNNGNFWNILEQMKGSNFHKQFNDEALPLAYLSKQYKESFQKKHNRTIKQPNVVKSLKTLTQ